MLKILLDFYPNISHKSSKFSKTLLEKSLEFVSSRKDNTVTFNLDFVLFPVEIDPILKEYCYKRNAFAARGTGCVEILLPLLIEVIVLYMGVVIV